MSSQILDVEKLASAVEAARIARGLTAAEVAVEIGLSASTLTRLKQGKKPDADGLVSIFAWLGVGADKFTKGRGRKHGWSSGELRPLVPLFEAGCRALKGIRLLPGTPVEEAVVAPIVLAIVAELGGSLPLEEMKTALQARTAGASAADIRNAVETRGGNEESND